MAWRHVQSFVLFIKPITFLSFCNKKMDLTKLRRWRQRQRQKAIGLVSKTTTLQVHHAFSFISFRSLHNYDQILSFFEDGNGKAIHSTISVWTRRGLLSSVPT